jgi:hypothetical protein
MNNTHKFKPLTVVLFIVGGISILFILIIIPRVIDYAYLRGELLGIKKNTNYSASDWLLTYGSILSFIGTVVLGFVALIQNRNANEMNERMVTIQNQKFIPILKMEDNTWDYISTASHLISSRSAIAQAGHSTNLVTKEKTNEIQLRIVNDYSAKCSEVKISFSLKNISDSIIQCVEIEKITTNFLEEIENNNTGTFHKRDFLFEKSTRIEELVLGNGAIKIDIYIISDNKEMLIEIYNLVHYLSFNFITETISGHKYKQEISFSGVRRVATDIKYKLTPI